MPNINEEILELIQSSDSPESSYSIDPTKNDYIRLSLFTRDGQFVDYFYSNLDADNNGVTYTADFGDDFVSEHLDPMGTDFGYGGAPLSATEFLSDTLTQYCLEGDVNTGGNFLGDENSRVEYTTETFDDGTPRSFYYYDIGGGYWVQEANVINATYLTSITCIQTVGVPDSDTWSVSGTPQINIYTDTNDIPFIKPSEVLDNALVPQGNYKLEFDFYRDTIDEIITNSTENTGLLDSSFYKIIEISPSRKEVRIIVKSLDDSFNQQQFDYVLPGGETFAQYLENSFLTQNNGSTGVDNYEFHHVLNLNRGRNILITNYIFDTQTDPNNTTLVLRLHSPLPSNVPIFSDVEINRELIKQQTKNIYYVSNVKSVIIGGSLQPDVESFNEVINDQTQDSYQDYNDLYHSASFGENISDIISASMTNPDINLNIDFKDFSNHVFFGSAVSKLENFKTKVIQIEDYLTEISSSLNQSSESYHSSTHVSSRRKELFNKIQNIKTNFTPYERFMYNDNQYTATSSAPGIGRNLAAPIPVRMYDPDEPNNKILSNYEGFKTVYKHTDEGATNKWMTWMTNKYHVQDAPFFNYSSSIYLSFLIKADKNLQGSQEGQFKWDNNNPYDYNNYMGTTIPADALSRVKLINPNFTGSEYRRHVYVASQSWWRPTQYAGSSSVLEGGAALPYQTNNMATKSLSSQNPLYPEYMILSGSMIPTGSQGADADAISVHNDRYVTYPSAYSGSIIVPDQKFSGSIMPMGELFRIFWYTGSQAPGAITSSFTTDIKITLKDPRNTLPFSHLYSTGSSEWNDWYYGMYDSASAYDDENIHSLKNNLPDHVRESSDSGDLKAFLHMIGEHFDLIRNYIDNYGKLYNRKYKEKESVPSNLLPILADNLGWEVINPFTSSLAEYFSTVSHDDNVQEIGYTTWRKILNNLIYIYKSKGTLNSVRALLNIYGYPPDILTLNEYGGSVEEHNPVIITNDAQNVLTQGLGGSSDNISYVLQSKRITAVNLTGKSRKLNFHWWTGGGGDSSKDARGNGIQFIFMSRETTNDQVLVKSSGSGTETPWDIRLVTSASHPVKGKLEFRLNNSFTGSLAIADNALSMSTNYYELKDPTKIWNVYLTRMTGSNNSKITQSYQLMVGYHTEDKISKFEIVSMSVVDPMANVNFMTGSSLDITSSLTGTPGPISGNLVFGETFTGSIAEVRLWSGSLSASKFKQHVLNPTSIVGNDENFSRNNLVYHYRLNENPKFKNVTDISRGTITDNVFKDANPNNFQNFSLTHSLDNDGTLYNSRIDKVVKLTTRIGGVDHKNSNKTIIDPKLNMVRELNPTQKSFQPLADKFNKNGKKRTNTTKIDMTSSPSDPVDDYIIRHVSDIDLGGKFGHPSSSFDDSYKDLDDFRNTLLQDVKVDINKFINSQKGLYNPSLVKGIEKLLPGRSTIKSVGVVVKQNLLERSKYKYHKPSIHTGSAAGFYEGDFGSLPELSYNFTQSSYESPYTGSVNFIVDIYNLTQSSYISPYSSSIVNISDTYINFTSSRYIIPYSSSIDVNYFNLTSSKYLAPYSSSLSVYGKSDGNIINVTSSFNQPYSSSLDVYRTHYNLTSSEYLAPYSSSLDVYRTHYNLTSSKYVAPYSSSLDVHKTYFNLTSSEYLAPYSSSVNVNYFNLTSSRYIAPYSTEFSIVSDKTEVVSKKIKGKYSSGYVNVNLSSPEDSFNLTGSNYDSIEFKLTGSSTITDSTITAARATGSITVNSTVSHSNAFYITGSDLSTSIGFVVQSIGVHDTSTTKYFLSASNVRDTVDNAVEKINKVFPGYITASRSGISIISLTSSFTNGDAYRGNIANGVTGSLGFTNITGMTGGRISSSVLYFNTGSKQFVGRTRDHYTAVSASTKINNLFKDNWITASVAATNYSTGSITVKSYVSHSDSFSITGSDGLTSIKFECRKFPLPASTATTRYFVSASTVNGTLKNAVNTINGFLNSHNWIMATSSEDKIILSGSFKSNVQGLPILSSSDGFYVNGGMSTSTTRLILSSSETGISQEKPLSGSGGFHITSGMTGGKISSSIDNIVTLNYKYVNLTSSEYLAPYSSSINVNYFNLTSSKYLAPYSSSLDVYRTHYNLSSSKYFAPHSSSIDMNYYNFTGSQVLLPYSASIREVADYSYFGEGLDIQGNSLPKTWDGYDSSTIFQAWGTSVDQVHFIHFAKSGDGDYNTYHNDSRRIFYIVGDVEQIVSTSRDADGINKYTVDINPTEVDTFSGRLFTDKGKGYTYKSYVGTGSNVNGAPVDGRPIGRTAFFSSSGDGTIYYPSNHYVNVGTSKQSVENLIYRGSKAGNTITVVSDDEQGNLIDTVHVQEDPLHLVKFPVTHYYGYPDGGNTLISASSYAVHIIDVGGSDTENVLQVIRRT